MTLLAKDRMTDMYNMKKESAEKRAIHFGLTLGQFTELYKARSEVKCFYTDVNLDLTATNLRNYPSMDRICNTKGYEVGNVVWCSTEVNKLKGEIIETQTRSLKNCAPNEIKIVARINKILADARVMEHRLKAYDCIFHRAEAKVLHEQSERMKGLEEQRIKLEKEKAEKAAQEELEAKFRSQQELAAHYNKTFMMFDKLGVLMMITLKDFRDIMRVTKCKISGEEFKSSFDKKMFVVDKTLPITKDNVWIVTEKSQQAIDHLTGGSYDTLQMVTKNLNKLVK
ncbi:coil containing protein [Vibrio phage 1.121.O._10N.286.46.C4]|nr:coil containing protein [Vibrio phage 1.121.O._10N.286.46.C4]